MGPVQLFPRASVNQDLVPQSNASFSREIAQSVGCASNQNFFNHACTLGRFFMADNVSGVPRVGSMSVCGKLCP